MPKALVVYETMWGHTGRIADAIAEGLAPSYEVACLDADAAPTDLDGIDLLVIGGPTHAFSMSRPQTRADAAEKGAASAAGTERGMRGWLATASGQADRAVAFVVGAHAVGLVVQDHGVRERHDAHGHAHEPDLPRPLSLAEQRLALVLPKHYKP